MRPDPLSFLGDELNSLKAQGLYRHLRVLHREQVPPVGDSLERVAPPVGEADAGAEDEHLHGAGDQHLTGAHSLEFFVQTLQRRRIAL